MPGHHGRICRNQGKRMKEKIERFAKGEFDYRKPKLMLPAEPVRWKMEPDTEFSGCLKFGSENDVRIRGYAVCSDGNLKLKNPKFYGKDIRIDFIYSSSHLKAGDVKKGKWILITNAGEFFQPFEVEIVGQGRAEGEGFYG